MPGTITDARDFALRNKGFAGTASDQQLSWLKSLGGVGNTVRDLWASVLAQEGYHGRDAFYDYLGAQGFEGSRNDRELQFWQQGGAVEPPPAGTNVFTSESLDGGYFWGFDATGGSLTPTTLANHPGANVTIFRGQTGGALCMIRHDQVPEAGSSILFAIPGYRFTFNNTGSDYTLQSNTLSAWFATGPVAVDVALIYVPA